MGSSSGSVSPDSVGLEREPVALAVHPAARADEGVEEVARIELDSRLFRQQMENASAVGLPRARPRISSLSFGFDRLRTQLWSYPRPITSWGYPSRIRSRSPSPS